MSVRIFSFVYVLVFALTVPAFVGTRVRKARKTSCPNSYILVPPLSGYTPTAFCVAKYEAKQSGSNALSQASGLPWVSINRADARTACQNNGSSYDLISNSEWQTIARNIVDVSGNWSSGSANSGNVNKGHDDNVPASTIEASADDNDSCYNTGQTCSLTVWDSQRRTHVLSNGNVIWDLAGNASEWTQDDNASTYASDGYISNFTSGTKQTKFGNDNFCGGGNCGYGYGYVAIAGGSIIRGGNYQVGGGVGAGVFAADITAATTTTHAKIGFRCVMRL